MSLQQNKKGRNMKIAKIVLALSAVYSSSIAFGATDAAVATALGGGATVNSSGALTAPSYTVGGATNNNVGAALTALEKKHNTDVAVLRNTSTQINVKTNTNGTSTAAALGGGSTYVATTGQITAPNYVLGAKSYNNVGGALQGLSQSITASHESAVRNAMQVGEDLHTEIQHHAQLAKENNDELQRCSCWD